MAVHPLNFRWGSELIWKVLFAIMILSIVLGVHASADKDKPKKKKDIRDFNDADMERLFQEWEEAEEEHDPDDLSEHERPSPTIDLSKIDLKNPEEALKMTKKGKTLMMFVTVSGDPTEEETDKITARWQSMLFNAQFNFQRFPEGKNRAILLLKDGSTAWEIKDFLIQQDRCQQVSIENQVYYGKGSGKSVDGKGQFIGKEDAQTDQDKDEL